MPLISLNDDNAHGGRGDGDSGARLRCRMSGSVDVCSQIGMLTMISIHSIVARHLKPMDNLPLHTGCTSCAHKVPDPGCAQATQAAHKARDPGCALKGPDPCCIQVKTGRHPSRLLLVRIKQEVHHSSLSRAMCPVSTCHGRRKQHRGS